MESYNIDYIICCGMPRSGSTLQYQIVKEILEKNGFINNYGWLNKDDMSGFFTLQKNNYKKPILIKVHDFHPIFLEERIFKNSLFIYVHRDVRDVFISHMNKWKFNFDKLIKSNFLDEIENNYFEWINFKRSYKTDYTNLTNNTKEQVVEISKYLNLELNNEEALLISEKLSIDKQKEYIKSISTDQLYDNNELLHWNHINSGESNQWRKLSLDQIKILEEKVINILKSQNLPVYSHTIDFKIKYYIKYITNKSNIIGVNLIAPLRRFYKFKLLPLIRIRD
jgi:hypothetical protein